MESLGRNKVTGTPIFERLTKAMSLNEWGCGAIEF